MSKKPDLKALEAAGAYNPQAENAADRKALLEYLGELGATTEELISAKEPLWMMTQELVGREYKPYSARDSGKGENV